MAERQGVFVSDRIEMSVAFLPTVFAAIVFGPFAAFLLGGLSQAADFRGPKLRWLVYTNIRALCGALPALAATQVTAVTPGFGRYLLVSLVASGTWIAADTAFGLATCAVRGANVVSFFRHVAPFFSLSWALCLPLVALFVYGYHAYSLWVSVACLIPLLAVQRLVHLYQEERNASRELAAANARLGSANLSFATALVATLDARDRYTAGHSAAVAIYARDIAVRLGLSQEQQDLVHLCGLVHDVGKIGLPAGLLEKPGALTLEERRQMEKHSEIGEQILRKVDDYGEIADIVRHHHERVDGLGYPDGLPESEIPLLARVIAVADAYNAMTSDRPYREALPSRVARLRLAQAVESQFDTTVVAAFEAILAGADEAYRMGTGSVFALDSQTATSAESGLPEAEHPAVVAAAGF
jgi:putative nucleotidyltransferase with HDIG domain